MKSPLFLVATCLAILPFGSSFSQISMKIKCGLVGLPNVGKSTLFNAISQKTLAQAKNFPFCTIEPNITPIPIPDVNLHRVAEVGQKNTALPAYISLIDVAGLAKGASRGEGLGNKFLATVRECDMIIHVVRNYEDDDVIHVDGVVDAVSDATVVNLELLLADLAHVERRLERTTCVDDERDVLLRVKEALENGVNARSIGLSLEEKHLIKSMGLLTLKPVLYAFNSDEVDFTLNKEETSNRAATFMSQIQYCDPETDAYTLVSAKFESQIALLSADERDAYLESVGVDCSTQFSYHTIPLLVKDILNLALAYTGPGVPPERSLTTKTHIVVPRGVKAIELASKLHGDIERGFTHAEIVDARDMIMYNSYNEAKDNGKVRMEGKDYYIKDNDVVLIKWRK